MSEEATNVLFKLETPPKYYLIDYCVKAEKNIKKYTPKTPCDLCAYNPPSSTDGKPCSMCPAVERSDAE